MYAIEISGFNFLCEGSSKGRLQSILSFFDPAVKTVGS